MKKNIIIIIIVIFVLVLGFIVASNIPNKALSKAFKNIEKLSEEAKNKEEVSSDLESHLKYYDGLKIKVSKKKIKITEKATNKKYLVFYNLDDSITFYTLTEVNNKTSYYDYLSIVEESKFIIELCYTAFLNSKGEALDKSYSYISEDILNKLSASKEDNYLFFNGNKSRFENYELSEEDKGKNVVFVPEFEKYAVDYFSDVYKNIVIDDREGNNTYKMLIKTEKINKDKCIVKYEIKVK